MMGNLLSLLIAFILGLGLGGIYFGGLWLTLKQLPQFSAPWRLLIASFLTRLAIILIGFYWIIKIGFNRQIMLPLLLSFLGFLGMRTFLIIRLKPRPLEISNQ